MTGLQFEQNKSRLYRETAESEVFMSKLSRSNCTISTLNTQPNSKYRGALRSRLEKMSGINARTKISSWKKNCVGHIVDEKASSLLGVKMVHSFFEISAKLPRTSIFSDCLLINWMNRRGDCRTIKQPKSLSLTLATVSTTSSKTAGKEEQEEGGGENSDPDQPPRPYCLPSQPHLTNPRYTTKINSSINSRCLASSQCLMAHGGGTA